MSKKNLIRRAISMLVFSICLSIIATNAARTGASAAFQDGKESLHGVLQKTQLDPPLRDDIKRIRFSPDGKYVLAQDDAGINVLTRLPFATLFRIEAPRVSAAQFTPDSQNIIFHSIDLQVQSWSVSQQKLISKVDVKLSSYCNQALLSPDGKTLACLEVGTNLLLVDVATSAQISRQVDFYTLPFEGMLVFFPLDLFRGDSLNRHVYMEFSPDGRYFAAGVRHLRQRTLLNKSRVVADAARTQNPRGYEDDPNSISENRSSVEIYNPADNAESSRAVAFDLTKRKQMSLGGSLKDILAGGFTFISPDRVVGVNWQDRAKSALVTFPGGETIKALPLEQGELDAPGRGEYVLIRPLKNFPVGVMNLADGSLMMANKKSAIDIHGDVYVAERTDGEIGLYGLEKKDLRSKVQLPRTPLTFVGAVAHSPDFTLLAISGRTRAAMWNLSTGQRLFFLRKFNGAYYAEDGTVYVDFPRHESAERTIAILQPQQRQVSPAHVLEDSFATRARQHGQFLVILRSAGMEYLLPPTTIKVPISQARNTSSNENVILEVRDIRTMAPLWSKDFPKEAPTVWVDAPNETMVLRWKVTDEAAKSEIKRDTRLSKRLAAMREKEGDEFIQVVDARSGQLRGSLLLETEKGSFHVWQVFAVNDSVLMIDSTNHVSVYSLVSGEQVGIVSGTDASANRNSGLLCVKSDAGNLTIYALASMQERDRFLFSSEVALARFSTDGKRLFVLTQNQTAYVLDLAQAANSTKP